MAHDVGNFMPLYIADYLADTSHLSTLQHGAYLLLLLNYWRRGSKLPGNDAYLAQVARLPVREWQKHRDTIAQLFTVKDGWWIQKRVEEELARARSNFKSKSEAGAKGAAKRWRKNGDADGAGIAAPSPSQCQTDATSPSHSPIGENTEADASVALTRPPAPKGTRLANDWQPSEADFAYARELGYTDAEIAAECSEFREYFISPDAKRPVKKDWPSALKRWLRENTSRRFAKRARAVQSGGNRRGPGSVLAALSTVLDHRDPSPQGMGGAAAVAPVFAGADRAQSADAGGDGASLGCGKGSVIDGEWSRVPQAAGGVEIPHAAEGGGDGGHCGADRDLRTQAGGLPGGCGEAGFDEPERHQPMVAGMVGAEGQIGILDAQAAPNAESADDGLDIPAFLKRTA